MIKKVNENINIEDLDNAMLELESRPETVCCAHVCGAKFGFCGLVLCGAYLPF